MTNLMQENVELKKKAVFFERTNKEVSVKLERSESQLKNTRVYAQHLSSDMESYKHKDIR